MRTFLGTGLLGAAMAEAAAARGERVVAWNRSRAKAEPLAQHGIHVATTARDAVVGAALVHIAVTSDAAVDAVLDDIADALVDGAVVVDHSTTAPEGTAARALRCAERGLRYLHAPVMMSPQACRDAKGLMLVAGSHAVFDAVEPELARMTGKVWFTGEPGDRAAVFKLLGNALVLAMLGGLADIYTIADNYGITAAETLEMFEHFDPGVVIQARGTWMAERNFATAWSLGMARKDLGLMVDAAQQRPLAVLPGLGARMDALIAEGETDRDVGILARDTQRD